MEIQWRNERQHFSFSWIDFFFTEINCTNCDTPTRDSRRTLIFPFFFFEICESEGSVVQKGGKNQSGIGDNFLVMSWAKFSNLIIKLCFCTSTLYMYNYVYAIRTNDDDDVLIFFFSFFFFSQLEIFHPGSRERESRNIKWRDFTRRKIADQLQTGVISEIRSVSFRILSIQFNLWMCVHSKINVLNKCVK